MYSRPTPTASARWCAGASSGLLTALTQLGAIVNFQVVTDGGVNTPDDIANGRLIVQLLVAPTNPVEFITVTLVRAGEGLLDVLEG